MIKYYVKNDKTGDILGKDGKWVRKPTSEDALSFDKAADAESARPSDTPSTVLSISRPESRPVRA
jgi:hypothetical protein